MREYRYRRNTKLLCVVLLLGAVYIGLLYNLDTLTGSRFLDGTIGVMLGLYVCSQPAANAIDVLFFHRGALREISSGWLGFWWLALNASVLLLGWTVITIGATQLTRTIG